MLPYRENAISKMPWRRNKKTEGPFFSFNANSSKRLLNSTDVSI